MPCQWVWPSWWELHPVHQNEGLIPGQGTYWRQWINVSLPHCYFSLPPPISLQNQLKNLFLKELSYSGKSQQGSAIHRKYKAFICVCAHAPLLEVYTRASMHLTGEVKHHFCHKSGEKNATGLFGATPNGL